jgi:hypothetical protein
VDGMAFKTAEDDIRYNFLAREKESFINVQYRALSETYSSATLRWIGMSILGLEWLS